MGRENDAFAHQWLPQFAQMFWQMTQDGCRVGEKGAKLEQE